MANENQKATYEALASEEEISLNDLAQCLQAELDDQLADLESLKEEGRNLDNPDRLGDILVNVVWQQFLNQMALTAGEDFIQENRGLTLDLREEAHIQTTENFAEGKIASHNHAIDYQQRYDDWQNNFQRNDDGSIRTKTDYRTGEERAVLRVKDTKKDPEGNNPNLNYNAREFIDKDRPKGTKTVNKDHTISAAEIIRDPEAAAHLSRDEQAAFANDPINLLDLDSAANQSKGDSSMGEWLDSERTGKGAGQSQADYFGVDEQELRSRDAKAREEYDSRKKEGEKRSIETGKKSQKEEFYRIGKTALRSALMAMLATLLKEVMGKLVLWLRSPDKSLHSLADHIKRALLSFVQKLKNLLVNTADSVLTTVVTSIVGPVIGTIKKTVTLLKQGWNGLREAIQFLRAPENRGRPLGELLPQVGILVIGGLSGMGAMALGEVLEKSLMTIPFLAVDIPMLGSPANLIGTLMGAIAAGIIGAIAIYLIQQYREKKLEEENLRRKNDKQNEILNIQGQLLSAQTDLYEKTEAEVTHSIALRHREAGRLIQESLQSLRDADVAQKQKMNEESLDRLLQGL